MTSDEKEEKGQVRSWRGIGLNAIIILAVVCLGLFAVNQILEYHYKIAFLKTPCVLCRDLNPNISSCIEGCVTFKQTLYPNGLGGWYNPYLNRDGSINITINITEVPAKKQDPVRSVDYGNATQERVKGVTFFINSTIKIN